MLCALNATPPDVCQVLPGPGCTRGLGMSSPPDCLHRVGCVGEEQWGSQPSGSTELAALHSQHSRNSEGAFGHKHPQPLRHKLAAGHGVFLEFTPPCAGVTAG